MNNDIFQPKIHFSSKKEGWRCRVKLIFGPKKIGLYKAGTHLVEDASTHPDHHPLINEVLREIKNMELEPYDETKHTGVFRAVQITVDPKSESAQVAFSVVKPISISLKNDKIVSLWINVNPHKTNTLFSHDWRHLSGERLLPVSLCGETFFFHPGTFIQANIALFERAIQHILDHLPPGKTLTEYYAGIGVIGTILSPYYTEVTCIEINPFAEACFLQSIPPKNVSFVTGATEDSVRSSDVALLDPPRKGVDVKPLYTIDAPQIVYMSCNPKTFMRDAEMLFERGYELHHLASFDFFPGTGHLELLGFFHRSDD